MSELSEQLNQQRKYSVVRFRGTVQFNRDHELVFQSDDAPEAMNELERRCADDNGVHGYTLIIK
jgi:hypothetical protein